VYEINLSSYNTIDQEQPILINYSQCQAKPFTQISQINPAQHSKEIGK